MSVSIKYKGTEIASASTETTKTLKTSGKYCEADIIVENTPDGGDAPVINPLNVTANGTYTAPSGVDGYSPVTVNVPQGITPTGKKLITDTSETDVAAFATAQVSSDTLLPENIKKNVNILGIVGSFEGGGGGGLEKIGTATTDTSAGTGYGQISIPANDGIFLLTNVSVTPDNSNRLPWAMFAQINTTAPSQAGAAFQFNYGTYGFNTNAIRQIDGVLQIDGASAYRFGTSAAYDIYKLY